MNHNYHNVNQALPALAREILRDGREVGSRLGERVQEILHTEVTLLHPTARYVTVPGRRASLPAQIMETIWVLSGRNDIALIEPYLPRAADFSDDGVVWRGGYGPRIRSWGNPDAPVDQVRHVMEVLMRDHTSRRAIMSIYDPEIDTEPGKDIPCNNWLTFQSRLGRLNMHVAIRSNDLIWGWSGINQFEWSALQEIMAAMLGLQVGQAHFSISSFHIYDRHWKKAKQIADTHEVMHAPTESPRFEVNERWMPADATDAWSRMGAFDLLLKRFVDLESTIRRGMAPRHAVDHFPEPMLRSWLRVLAAYWADEDDQAYWLEGYEGTALSWAFAETPVNPAVKERMSNLRKRNGITDAQDDARLEAVALVRAATTNPEQGIDLDDFLEEEGIDLGEGFDSGVLRQPTDEVNDRPKPSFVRYVSDLHASKHAAYGDSWKRRGEQMGIMANIARKVDRLGVSDDNETAADTAIDLLVYLLKYERWLVEQWDVTPSLGEVEWVRDGLKYLQTHTPGDIIHPPAKEQEQTLREDLEKLEDLVRINAAPLDKREHVVVMQRRAFVLAHNLWETGQHG